MESVDLSNARSALSPDGRPVDYDYSNAPATNSLIASTPNAPDYLETARQLGGAESALRNMWNINDAYDGEELKPEYRGPARINWNDPKQAVEYEAKKGVVTQRYRTQAYQKLLDSQSAYDDAAKRAKERSIEYADKDGNVYTAEEVDEHGLSVDDLTVHDYTKAAKDAREALDAAKRDFRRVQKLIPYFSANHPALLAMASRVDKNASEFEQLLQLGKMFVSNDEGALEAGMLVTVNSLAAQAPEVLKTTAITVGANIAKVGTGPVGAGVITGAELIGRGLVGGKFSYDVERVSGYLEVMEEAGVDITNPEEVLAAQNRPDLQEKFAAKTKRALVVGGFDFGASAADAIRFSPGNMLRILREAKSIRAAAGNTSVMTFGDTLKAASMTVGKQGLAGRTGDKLANIGFQTALQGALGGAGEFFGQKAEGAETNMVDVALEIFGELGPGVAEAVGASTVGVVNERRNTVAAEQAKQSQNALTDLVRAAEGAQVALQDGERVREWVERVGGDQVVFIDGKVAMDQGLVEEIRAVDPLMANRLEQGAQNGESVAVPVASLAQMATNPDNEKLAEKIIYDSRTIQDGMSPREAEEFAKNGRQQAIDHFEREIERAKPDITTSKLAHKVATDLGNQLASAGMPRDYANAVAKPWEAYLVNRAKQLGISPEEIARRLNLRVQRRGGVYGVTRGGTEGGVINGVDTATPAGAQPTTISDYRAPVRVTPAGERPLTIARQQGIESSIIADQGEGPMATVTIGRPHVPSSDSFGQTSAKDFNAVVSGTVAARDLKGVQEKTKKTVLDAIKDSGLDAGEVIRAMAEIRDMTGRNDAGVGYHVKAISLNDGKIVVEYGKHKIPVLPEGKSKWADVYSLSKAQSSVIDTAVSQDPALKPFLEKEVRAHIDASRNDETSTQDTLVGVSFVDGVPVPMYAKIKWSRVLRRGTLRPEEQAVVDGYFDRLEPNESERIRKNLKDFAGTPWAEQAIESIFVREAVREYAEGRTPTFDSAVESQTALIAGLKASGYDAIPAYLYDHSLIGSPSKCTHAVDSSFLNCNPSKDCAKFCYAASGNNYQYDAKIVGSELVDMFIKTDPARAASMVASAYKGMSDYAVGKLMLRLFDKGDGAPHWIPFVEELNKQGVYVQIFSKRPDFLKQVPEGNVALLSVDRSNLDILESPDAEGLPLSFALGDESMLSVAKDLQDRVGVFLPIKQFGGYENENSGELATKAFVDKLRHIIKNPAKICPIDALAKDIAPVTIEPRNNKKGFAVVPQGKNGLPVDAKKAWNCLMCQWAGTGCFFKGNEVKSKKVIQIVSARAAKSNESADSIAVNFNKLTADQQQLFASLLNAMNKQNTGESLNEFERAAVQQMGSLMDVYQGRGGVLPSGVGSDGRNGGNVTALDSGRPAAAADRLSGLRGRRGAGEAYRDDSGANEASDATDAQGLYADGQTADVRAAVPSGRMGDAVRGTSGEVGPERGGRGGDGGRGGAFGQSAVEQANAELQNNWQTDDTPSMAEVRAKYEGTDEWMKAPNGKPTNLTERQWLQVRTPEFKLWFGDWDIKNTKFDIVYAGRTDINSQESAIAKASELGIIGTIPSEETNGKGDIQITVASLREMLNPKQRAKTGDNATHYAIIPVLREVIKSARIVSSSHDYAKDSSGVRTPAAGINNRVMVDVAYAAVRLDDGKVHPVRIRLKRYKDENQSGKAYSYHVENVEVLSGTLGQAKNGSNPADNTSIVSSMLLDGIPDVNGHSVLNGHSKVVDENGEPKVVYHITDEQFSTFDMSKARQYSDIPAAFFSSGTSDWADMGRYTMGVFLNIRNPADKPYVGGRGQEVLAELKAKGFDGTISHEDGMETEYAAFEPNQIKSATGNNGNFDWRRDNVFEQSANQDRRGQYTPSNIANPDYRKSGLVELMEHADKSTFLHESAHAWLDADTMLAKDLRRVLASGQELTTGEKRFLNGLAGFFRWGVKEGVLDNTFNVKSTDFDGIIAAAEAWSQMSVAEQRDMHELFAEGFESYLMNGRAPNAEMLDVFQRFAEWLKDVYRAVTKQPRPISKDVAKLYDMLFVSEQEAKEAEARAAASPLFQPEPVDTDGMSPDEKSQYELMVQRAKAATEEAIRKVMAKSAAFKALIAPDEATQVARTQKDRLERVKKMLEEMPKHKARKMILEGNRDFYGNMQIDPQSLLDNGFDKETVKVLQRKKLCAERGAYRPDYEERVTAVLTNGNVDEQKAREAGYSDSEIEDLKKRIAEDKRIASETSRQTVTPEQLAELCGADDPMALVAELVEIEAPHKEALGIVAAQVRDEMGIDPEVYSETLADLAAHNDERSQLLTAEYNAICRKLGRRQFTHATAREWALNKINSMKVGEIYPKAYIRDEAKNARKAEEAFRKGDLAGCLEYKRAQIAAHHMAKAALELQAAREKATRLAGMASRSDRVDGMFRKAIQVILQNHYMGNMTAAEREEYSKLDPVKLSEDFVKELQDAGTPVEGLANLMSDRSQIKDMTVNDARTLFETLSMLNSMGRNRVKQGLIDEAQTVGEVVKSGKARLQDAPDMPAQVTGAIQDQPRTRLEKTTDKLRQFFISHVSMQTFCRVLDGNKDGGWWWKLFIRSANRRANFENAHRGAVAEQLREIFRPVFKKDQFENPVRIDGFDKPFDHGQRLVIALNLGNESNRQRLVGGDPRWTPEAIKQVLDTLTEADWRAVEQVWKLFESYRPLIAAKEKRVNGVEPEWIDFKPFDVVTAEGKRITVSGGYYPVKFNPRASNRAQQYEDAASTMSELQSNYQSSTTRRSFVKSRQQAVMGMPLTTEFTGLYDGLNDIIHDLAWHEWLIETKKVLDGVHGSGGLREDIRQRYGTQYAKMLEDWRKDIAQGGRTPSDSDVGAICTPVSKYVGLITMGWNLMSGAVQLLGAGYAVPRAGAGNVLIASRKFCTNFGLRKQINEKSAMMALRAKTMNRDIAEIRNKLENSDNFIRDHAFDLIQLTQGISDTITWQACYESAIKQGMTEAEAIEVADQGVIDTQSSGNVSDQSAIMRDKGIFRIFTTFYSWANAALNMSVYTKYGESNKVKKLAALLWMGMAMPIIEKYYREALTAEGDDDDKDDPLMHELRKAGGAVAEYHLGLLVGAREFSNTVGSVVAGEPVFGYSGPAGMRPVQTVASAFDTAANPTDRKVINTVLDIFGCITGAPSAQAKKTVKGIMAIDQGRVEGMDAVLAPLFGYSGKLDKQDKWR